MEGVELEPVGPRPLSLGAAARACRVQRVTFYRWVKDGRIPSFATPGGHHRVERRDLERFMAEHGFPTRGRRRVLLVEDEAPLRRAYGRFLEAEDLEVTVTGDGYEACILVGSLRPEILVLDLYLPRVDGFEICRRVRSTPATAGVRVVAITGSPRREDLERIRRLGADEVLEKPIARETLRAAVRGVLASPRAAAPEREGGA